MSFNSPTIRTLCYCMELGSAPPYLGGGHRATAVVDRFARLGTSIYVNRGLVCGCVMPVRGLVLSDTVQLKKQKIVNFEII